VIVTATSPNWTQDDSDTSLLRPQIFGSVLTGKDDENSDLDLLVEPIDSTSLLTMAVPRYAKTQVNPGLSQRV
jgi:predicted nucleotidyltransferase